MTQQTPTPQPVTTETIYALRDAIGDLFVVQDVTLDWPEIGFARFRGSFACDLADCFQDLRQRFERHGFTPTIRREGVEGQVSLVAMPGVFDPPPSNWYINLLLLVLTILSTLLVGAASEPGFTGRELWLGLPFSLSLMLILGAHELGHYFAARYHKVPVTLPYFIPMPFSIIGTMGAFIRLKAPIYNRRALLDIGVAGPLAGMVFAVPLLILGLLLSPVAPLPAGTPYILEGNSILYALLKFLVFGQMLPDGQMDVSLGQIAWAGWVGLLVTGLNLIPVGQLDGGHVAYVLFGQHARKLFWPVIFSLLALGILTQTAMWGFWVFLLYFLGRSHAEPLDNVTPLDGRRRLIAIGTLLLFFLVFVPIPLRFITP
jgi:membrane-associated protease RseP (regulator of RpoE activity)